MATDSQSTIIESWTRSFPVGGYYSHGRTVRADGNVLAGRWGSDALAVYLPAGRKRSRPVFLVTGDRWGSAGWGHTNPQEETRRECARVARETGADMLLVPFSALAAAGVDVHSIRPLEIRPDDSWTTYESVPSEVDIDGFAGAGYRKRTDGPVPKPGEPGIRYPSRGSHYRIHEWRDSSGRRYRRRERMSEWRSYPVAGPEPKDSPSWVSWPAKLWRHEWLDVPSLESPERLDGRRRNWGHSMSRDETGAWRVEIRNHRLGDSLFLADVLTRRTVTRGATVRDVIENALLCVFAERNDRLRGEPNPEPASTRLARFDTDEPISETVDVRTRRRFVSSFDRNEPGQGLYFLATLPNRSRARTVESAIDDLAPASVHAALARGRTVYRQGDIFAIATNLTDVDVYGFARSRARLAQWTSGARAKRGEIGYRRPWTAGSRRRARTFARKRFRAILADVLARSYESGVAWPRTSRRGHWRAGPGETFADRPYSARGRLRRANVARHTSRDDYRRRYGQNAARAWTMATDEAIAKYGPAPVRPDERDRIRNALLVHGTGHSATEVIQGPGGTVYIRGVLRHVPGLEPGRIGGRDHVNVKLGDGRQWFLAVRNTVPRMRDTPVPQLIR